MNNATSIATAGMAAAASRYSTDARITESREARKFEAEQRALDRAALEPGRKAEVELQQARIEESRAKLIINTITADQAKERQAIQQEKQAALDAGDKDRLEKANRRLSVLNSDSTDEMNRAKAYATLAEQARKAVDDANDQVKVLSDISKSSTPEGKVALDRALLDQKAAQTRYMRLSKQAEEALEATKIKVGIDAPAPPPVEPPKIIRYDNKGNPIDAPAVGQSQNQTQSPLLQPQQRFYRPYSGTTEGRKEPFPIRPGVAPGFME